MRKVDKFKVDNGETKKYRYYVDCEEISIERRFSNYRNFWNYVHGTRDTIFKTENFVEAKEYYKNKTDWLKIAFEIEYSDFFIEKSRNTSEVCYNTYHYSIFRIELDEDDDETSNLQEIDDFGYSLEEVIAMIREAIRKECEEDENEEKAEQKESKDENS